MSWFKECLFDTKRACENGEMWFGFKLARIYMDEGIPDVNEEI